MKMNMSFRKSNGNPNQWTHDGWLMMMTGDWRLMVEDRFLIFHDKSLMMMYCWPAPQSPPKGNQSTYPMMRKPALFTCIVFTINWGHVDFDNTKILEHSVVESCSPMETVYNLEIVVKSRSSFLRKFNHSWGGSLFSYRAEMMFQTIFHCLNIKRLHDMDERVWADLPCVDVLQNAISVKIEWES